MTGTRWDMDNVEVVGTATLTISSATTANFDFGTPDDLNTANLAGYSPNDRLLAVFSALTNGTTSGITWSVQDADDSSGSIGTPATAVTNVCSGALAAGTGNDLTAVAVKIQPGRPWFRFRVTSDGTDSFACRATVLSVPNNA